MTKGTKGKEIEYELFPYLASFCVFCTFVIFVVNFQCDEKSAIT
jgi:hypothetical protein